MTLIPHANDKSVPTPTELRRHVARATGRLRDTAVHVGRLVEDKTPDPVLAGRSGRRRASGTRPPAPGGSPGTGASIPCG